jgi:hypothetical protein
MVWQVLEILDVRYESKYVSNFRFDFEVISWNCFMNFIKYLGELVMETSVYGKPTPRN